MAVSEESLDEFIELYEQAEGERLPREEAREVAERTIAIYRLIMQLPPNIQSQIAPEAS